MWKSSIEKEVLCRASNHSKQVGCCCLELRKDEESRKEADIEICCNLNSLVKKPARSG